MKASSHQLDRLLCAAAGTSDEPAEMPFGFDSRVLAHLRSESTGDFIEVRRLLRRVVLLSLTVIAVALAGTYQELQAESDDTSGISLDQYAIADSAIDTAFGQ